MKHAHQLVRVNFISDQKGVIGMRNSVVERGREVVGIDSISTGRDILGF